jgi:PiT family inorganic phosphate transporter
MRWLRVGVRSAPVIGHVHRIAFAGQSLAYAMNDGQKSIAVVAVALASFGQGLRWWQLPFIGLLFWFGTLLRLRQVSRTIGAGFMTVRPWHAVSAELATTGAVMGSAVLGAPVSMSQTLASALIGSGASEGAHRVRWRAVLNLGVAWVLTLPCAALIAGTAALILTWSTR